MAALHGQRPSVAQVRPGKNQKDKQHMKSKPTILLTALALAATTILASAQDNTNPPAGGNNPGGGGRQRGGGQGGGNFQDFMQRMNDRLKTSLKVTDEEWAVLQPLIEKVQTAQREAGAGRGGFGGGPGGRGGGPGGPGGNQGGGNAPADNRPGAAESTALRTALESDSTSPDDIKAKLAALREVRKKGAADLAIARDNLKKVVTVRQEAVLVSMGILE
jgi:hypothetical protein